jgi:hypothetical protein
MKPRTRGTIPRDPPHPTVARTVFLLLLAKSGPPRSDSATMSTPTDTLRGLFSGSKAETSSHLMIVHPRYAPDLISGRKSVESRLGKDRRTPFGRVSPGDTVYLKSTGGPVFGAATVERVDEFEDLTPEDVQHLRAAYEDRILGGDTYWEAKADARFATLVWLGNVRPIADIAGVPGELLKPSRNAWRTLSLAENIADIRAA